MTFKLLTADQLAVLTREEKTAYWPGYVRYLSDNKQPIVRDLRVVGYNVPSVYDLGHFKEKYSAALHTLVGYAERFSEFHPNIAEGIVRRLAVPYAGTEIHRRLRAIWFANTNMTTYVQYALGLALVKSATKKDRATLEKLLLGDRSAEDAIIRKVYRISGRVVLKTWDDVRQAAGPDYLIPWKDNNKAPGPHPDA